MGVRTPVDGNFIMPCTVGVSVTKPLLATNKHIKTILPSAIPSSPHYVHPPYLPPPPPPPPPFHSPHLNKPSRELSGDTLFEAISVLPASQCREVGPGTSSQSRGPALLSCDRGCWSREMSTSVLAKGTSVYPPVHVRVCISLG